MKRTKQQTFRIRKVLQGTSEPVVFINSMFVLKYDSTLLTLPATKNQLFGASTFKHTRGRANAKIFRIRKVGRINQSQLGVREPATKNIRRDVFHNWTGDYEFQSRG